ncbi:MAG: hypothetical protein HS119_06980 [Flavobacteriales bacterium]|nr:hypothetical protein [Flavobacteriales bacterium]
MRKLIIISFLLTLRLNGFGQEITLPDSIKTLLANDSTVLSVKYEVFYTKNGYGTKDSEGWYFMSNYNPHINGAKQETPVIHRVGFWKHYRKDGSLSMTDFIPYKPINTVIMHNYDKDGVLKMKRFIIPIENTAANNALSKKNFSGIVLFNKLSTERYFKNGQISSSYSQVGLRNIGDYIIYFKNGQMKSKVTYNNEYKLEGQYLEWNEKGQILTIGNYKNGKKVEIWKWFDENGNIKKEKNYTIPK